MAGSAVVIDYHSQAEPAEALADRISGQGGRAIAVQADVSREAEVVGLFDEAVAAYGRVDVVVPNAEIQKDAKVAEMSLGDWNRVIGVNLTGQFLCAVLAPSS